MVASRTTEEMADTRVLCLRSFIVVLLVMLVSSVVIWGAV
jgi:hypothetical protein